jgi:tryptophanyl-tRNA synthetase
MSSFSDFFEAYTTEEERKKWEHEDLCNLIQEAKMVGITIDYNTVYDCRQLGISYNIIKRDLEKIIREKRFENQERREKTRNNNS